MKQSEYIKELEGRVTTLEDRLRLFGENIKLATQIARGDHHIGTHRRCEAIEKLFADLMVARGNEEQDKLTGQR